MREPTDRDRQLLERLTASGAFDMPTAEQIRQLVERTYPRVKVRSVEATAHRGSIVTFHDKAVEPQP